MPGRQPVAKLRPPQVGPTLPDPEHDDVPLLTGWQIRIINYRKLEGLEAARLSRNDASGATTSAAR